MAADPGPANPSVDVPLVHIIVLSWNRCETLLKCLGYIAQLDYPRFRIVVVDNASSDDSAAAVRKLYPEAHLILNEINLGYTGGANRGVRHALRAGSDYIWLLNDDTHFDRATLSRLVACAEKDRSAGALSPVTYYQNDCERLQFAGDYIDLASACVRSANKLDEANMPRGTETQVLYGAAMLIRADALRRIGLFDERLFAYWEDYDLSMRIAAAGMSTRVVVCAAIFHNVTLPASQGLSRPPHYYYLMTRNEFWFWCRYLPGGIRVLRRMLRCLGEAVAEAGMCRHRGLHECANASLDGVWNAWLSNAGSYEARRPMPRMLRRLLSWRPFFLRTVLLGEWSSALRRRNANSR